MAWLLILVGVEMSYRVAKAVVWELSARSRGKMSFSLIIFKTRVPNLPQCNGSNIVFDATRTVRVAQKARIDQGGF